ncbi:carboxypeptidase-like regulatory domain-containing protein [Aequorivita sp. CIP111184]|uniref:carboxypeptidase-like regulatory domain-containing protein n=1 Tax=Aequorivita sp. CIP111184 TaxID=2211356 RepID=UPI000DBBD2B8|nr:carboxypeptidase-like regulatory domain-containing protein [Aequorivita sp. CIP111184]SRX55650.1 TonB-dependent receptor SusC [Aequorivita sp. CIP111184]
MKKSIVIRIPEPCHEDWVKMTATEKGKFCNVCTKEVVDLTSKTDEELVKILTRNKNTCGKVKKSQLNREVKLERKNGQSFAPLAASMLLPLALFSNNPKNDSNSLSDKPMVSMGIGRFSNSIDRMQIVTEGIVHDENGNPLRNVEIASNETKIREWTNKNGEYRIITLDNERLTFNKENYEKQEIRVRNKSEKVNILLKSTLEEVAITEMKYVTMGMIAYVPEVEEQQKDSISVITKGNVTDDTGLPLPGANVIIKGTSKGTQTDFDGNYQIDTKPGDVLVFSYIAFETKEVTVSNISNLIDVELVGEIMGDMVTVTAGGIYWERYYDYEPSKDPDWYEKAKQAYKNTLKFMKIKQQQRKAERKAKRNNK